MAIGNLGTLQRDNVTLDRKRSDDDVTVTVFRNYNYLLATATIFLKIAN